MSIQIPMFSGIVESRARVVNFVRRSEVYQLTVEKPDSFDDIHVGDSVCVDGVCLTVESFTAEVLIFAVAGETLKITLWSQRLQNGSVVNLERSLKYGDRVHGHLVTGHVDGLAEVVELQKSSESLKMYLRLPEKSAAMFWVKGSITLNGVSLTINEVVSTSIQVWLIPETLRRTNLSLLNIGDFVNFEVDSLARYFQRLQEVGRGSH